jgi:hypothetical protein
MRELIARGRVPWWSDPGLSISFFRPLTSLTLVLDHLVAPWSAPPAHLHSFLWTALLVVAVFRLHRVLVPERAGVATVLYACATALTFSSAWISARHVLVGGTFSVLALERWLVADRGGPEARRDRLLGTLALVLGLLSSEGTAAVPLVYVVLCVRDGTKLGLAARRALPVLVVLLVYVALYVALGRGVRGSGGYLDPRSDPAGTLGQVALRLSAFMTDAYAGVPCDAAHGGLLGAYAAVGLALSAGLARLAVRAPLELRRRLFSLGGAALVAALPGTLGFYGGRVLILAIVFTTSVVALVVDWALTGSSPRPRAPAIALLVLLAGVSPVVRLLGTFGVTYMSFEARDAARRSLAACPTGHDRVILVASDPTVAIYTPVYWFAAGMTPDLSGSLLTMTPLPITITRTGPRALRLETSAGRFFEADWERFYRRSLPDALEVTTDTARFGWDADGNVIDYETLDQARWDQTCFLRWDGRALVSVEPPPLGDTVAVPHHLGPMGM